MKTTTFLRQSRFAIVSGLLLIILSLIVAGKLWADRRPMWRFKAKAGPWGEVECVRIAVEMPDAFISLAEVKGIHPHWFFRGPREDAVKFLETVDLTPEQRRAILEAKWEQSLGGYWVSPTDQLALSLSKTGRQQLYLHLAESPENASQHSPFTFREELLPELLKNSELSEETIRRFKELLYSKDNLLFFADADILVNDLSDDNERTRFLKTISRTATLLVKLKVNEKSDLDSLVKYWSYGGRSKDVRSLLQSMSGVPGGSTVDVAHLLPVFLRQRIYSYPNPDLVNVTNQHCHWTSMNFLNASPNDQYSEEAYVRETLQNQFVPVADAPQLGDVIFFLDEAGAVIHSATYIADNVVFTKNGGGVNRPWVYMEMEDLLALYLKPKEAVKTVMFRRKTV